MTSSFALCVVLCFAFRGGQAYHSRVVAEQGAHTAEGGQLSIPTLQKRDNSIPTLQKRDNSPSPHCRRETTLHPHTAQGRQLFTPTLRTSPQEEQLFTPHCVLPHKGDNFTPTLHKTTLHLHTAQEKQLFTPTPRISSQEGHLFTPPPTPASTGTRMLLMAAQ